ncbi:hypothetical protein N7497_011477 [Penicillium chrysogenum]|nr:hypothetical protein N7497_011477 [Penicillium chrysogenum]
MVTTSLSSLPSRHQVAPGPGSSWLHPEGLLDPSTTMRCEPTLGDKWPNIWQDKWQRTLQSRHGDEVPLFTSQSAPGFPGTGEQKAGDKWQTANRKMKMDKRHGDEVPLFTSQSAPGCPGTGEQKAGDR